MKIISKMSKYINKIDQKKTHAGGNNNKCKVNISCYEQIVIKLWLCHVDTLFFFVRGQVRLI